MRYVPAKMPFSRGRSISLQKLWFQHPQQQRRHRLGNWVIDHMDEMVYARKDFDSRDPDEDDAVAYGFGHIANR